MSSDLCTINQDGDGCVYQSTGSDVYAISYTLGDTPLEDKIYQWKVLIVINSY